MVGLEKGRDENDNTTVDRIGVEGGGEDKDGGKCNDYITHTV